MQIMAFLIHSQVIKHHRVLITQKCRLVTGLWQKYPARLPVLITQKCRLVTGGEAEKKQYDTEAMTQHYDRFCELEQAEIMRYKKKEKKDDRSTIGAENII